MTVSLYNRNPVAMTCEVTSLSPPSHLVRVTDDQQQRLTLEPEQTVFVELDPPSATQEPQTTVTMRADGRDVYVWEGQTRWDRDGNGTAYRTYVTPAEVMLQVVTLTTGSPPPAAPPTPGDNPAILKVKVRKKGGLPI